MKKILILILCIVITTIFLYYENNYITVNRIDIKSKKLPGKFNGYKIVHLSDVHNKLFGKDQKNLVDVIKSVDPDMIVVTGDLIDSRKYNAEISMELINQSVKIAPVYYVTGNHEWRYGKFSNLEKRLRESGVKVLRDKNEKILKGNERLVIAGVDDPLKFRNNQVTSFKNSLGKSLAGTRADEFKILLSHRPEKFLEYQSYKLDVVFSGHAHGGQVRLPFVGGIIAPGQGLFPRYTSGAYSENGTTMVVSRGLGNSVAPQRIFNRPEVVVVTLLRE
jgi:uncharacterized protein